MGQSFVRLDPLVRANTQHPPKQVYQQNVFLVIFNLLMEHLCLQKLFERFHVFIFFQIHLKPPVHRKVKRLTLFVINLGNHLIGDNLVFNSANVLNLRQASVVLEEWLPMCQLEKDAPHRPHIYRIRESLKAHYHFWCSVIFIRLYLNRLLPLNLASQAQVQKL